MNAAILYPFALSFGAEALVSLKRIEEFLLKEEKNESEFGLERRNSIIYETKRKNNNCTNNTIELFSRKLSIHFHFSGVDNAVEINNVSASWEEDSTRQTLQQINLKIRSGQLCALIGPVGAGKVR